MEFLPIERAVLDKFSEGEDADSRILRLQIEKSKVISRNNTGAGFYAEISIVGHCEALKGADSIIKDDVVCHINGIKNCAGFMLYIKEGFISCLEGYTFGDESWPNLIESFSCEGNAFK